MIVQPLRPSLRAILFELTSNPNLYIAKHFEGLIRLLVVSISLLLGSSLPAQAQGSSPMVVGSPTVDANGVQYYPVMSVYQGSRQQIVRVLRPTNPTAGKPSRILYVLPVDAGVDTLSSPFGDGLESLRLLDVPNRFNMTLVAPSFNYIPWFGDNVLEPTHWMESFVINDLVPFGDTLVQQSVPQRFLIGFSKSGNAAFFLLFRHPGIFNAAAVWDSPVQLSSFSEFPDLSLQLNFGTQANLNLYNIPALAANNAEPFQQNRLWISGDQANYTADMVQLHNQLTAASIPHTWVQGGTRAHTWGSGWLDGAVTGLDAIAQLVPPERGATPPVRSAGEPSGLVAEGTTQTTLSLTSDENATCRYGPTAGVAFASMTNTFSNTGGMTHSTVVTGLADGGSYNYFVRCQDSAGNANPDDYVVAFSVATASGGSTAGSGFTGTEGPLSEGGMWSTPGSWTSLQKNNGVFTTANTAAAARLTTPPLGADQYAAVTYDQDPGTGPWPGAMTRIQGAANGSGYLALAYSEQVMLFRVDDRDGLNFGLSYTLLASASVNAGAAPRLLRLESQGANHRIYFNGVLMLTTTDGTYTAGQPGIAIYSTPVQILSFTAGTLTGGADTTPPVRSAGQPSGLVAEGTTQTTLSLTTDENATCRYAPSAGVAFASMTNTFSNTGGMIHSTVVTGLADGGSYNYFVRCQDSAGNANPDDYVIAFSVATASGGSTASSGFTGTEGPLSEGGMWSTPGSWTSLQKNNGVFTTANAASAARLTTPLLGADQYAAITYDQDPGTGPWPGVMTRIQGAANGSGYLALAYAEQVMLFRVDDHGGLNYTLLASASVNAGAAPRLLRLESQGATQRIYFNGVLMLTTTDSTYTAGQPGIAIYSTPVRILSFTAGTLTGAPDTTPPVRSGGEPSGLVAEGTTQTTLSLTTDENATCRYAPSAGVAFASMASTFSNTGGMTHSTVVTGLSDEGSYNYFVRCQDSVGNANPDDYVIAFSVATASGGSTASSGFTGTESPLSEGGMWSTPGSWMSLQKNNGVFTTANAASAARLTTPLLGADQYAAITYDQDPGTGPWPGVMTRIQGAANGSGYLALAYAEQVMLFRVDDHGGLNYTLLASASVNAGAAPRLLRLESQGGTQRIYFNGVLMLTTTDSTYAVGQPGIAIYSTPVRILSFTAGTLTSN